MPPISLRVVQEDDVAGVAVEVVVDPFGDFEEPRVSTDRHPPHIDSGAARVGEIGAQHLRYSASPGGRVHMPYHPAAKILAGPRDIRLDFGELITHHRSEPLGRPGREVDFGQNLHLNLEAGAYYGFGCTTNTSHGELLTTALVTRPRTA